MVKCAECGLLAKRLFGTRDLVEVEQDDRSSGYMRHVAGQFVEDAPLCLMGKTDFIKRLQERVANTTDTQNRLFRDDVAAVLAEEIECKDGFYPHQLGRSPKKHREMMDRERMLEREDRRDAEMRAREDARDKRIEDLQRQLHNRELWIIGVAVTLALVVGSVAAAIVEGAVSSGWEPSWWPF